MYVICDVHFTASLLNPALMKHIVHLVIFFVFNVLLLTLDIYSDFATAADFFFNGDIYWCLSTLVPIFAPMLVRIIWTLFSLLKTFWKKDISRLDVQMKDLQSLIWHIPVLLPVKYVNICVVKIYFKK